LGEKGGVFRALHHILLPSSFQQPRPFAETDCSCSSSFSTTLILIACPSSVFIHYTVSGLSSGVGASKVSPRLTTLFPTTPFPAISFQDTSSLHIPSFAFPETSPLPSFERVNLARFGPSLCFFQLSLASCGWPLRFICDCLFACSLKGFFCIVFSSPFPLLGAIFMSTVLWGLSRRSSGFVSLSSVSPSRQSFSALYLFPLPRAVPFYFSRFPFRSSLSPASFFLLQMRAKGYFN